MPEKMNRFLMKTKEDGDLNQYWYSERSIAAIQREVEEQATKACFLSTPSIYFSLKKVRRAWRGAGCEGAHSCRLHPWEATLNSP